MEQIPAKIFELYLDHLVGTISADDRLYVQQQLETNPVFKAQWEYLEREGETIDAGDYLHRIDSAAALQQLKAAGTTPAAATVIPWKKWLAAAAVVLFLGLGGYYFLHTHARVKAPPVATLQRKQPVRLLTGNGEAIALSKDSSVQTIALNNATLNTSNGALQYTSADTVLNTLEVPAGENYQLTLSDGTKVWLNAATKLRFPFHFGRAAREVYIEGEAYFQVAANAQQPFTVHTSLTSVQVLGTAFNINTYQTGTVKTALVSGSVITRDKKNGQQMLTPGIQADYTNNQGFATAHFDEEEVLAWRRGVYYYHRMPLTNLLKEASRFYGIRFTLNDVTAANQVVTGLMDRSRLDDFLSDLATTAHISHQVAGNEIILK
ncbi:FecR domain-containing protein [Chitinophaga arvensicola]|uniref:Uncharacterized protein n=1 Tax=Chitinophaga arvensicola TaxID=29529 RepID=A0A1I0SBT3_9BACT|nr:FecR domain-containing protein [Chitinophaga arvensicola]SEW54082.1 protein of unknown function [Chitinophaga arvensicola]